MRSVICTEVYSYSTWISYSEISAMLGERFAKSLLEAYPRLYCQQWKRDFVPDLNEESSFELDLIFQFVNEFYDKDK